MSSRRSLLAALALFWLVIGAAYMSAASLQKQRVNLSATAGGQYPYLIYAAGIAREGVTRYFGDRNRMPLYPALLALAYSDDWDTFVERSAWFAVGSSLAVLLLIGTLAYMGLSRWPATALTLTAAVCVLVYKSSFVQAELLYYGLLFASWLALCRVIRRPSPTWAALGGVGLGLTYLTKASGASVLFAYGAAAVAQMLATALADRRAGGQATKISTSTPWHSVLLSGAIVLVSFLALTYPYLRTSNARFGRHFYNVNSTFFMWCDNWEQAAAFADKYRISEQYPQAPPDEIPGPLRYWRTHTPGQIWARVSYGSATLASLAASGPYFKYFALTILFGLVMGARQHRHLRDLARREWATALFSILFFAGYALAYVWYAQVAYGDRFVLSLFLPAMFSTLWVGERLSHHAKPLRVLGRAWPAHDVLAIALSVAVLCEGAWIMSGPLYRPGKNFVGFYYNESRALHLSGNTYEASKGYAGVIRLDPSFGPAHLGLGMIHLTSGQIDDAIMHLTQAVLCEPLSADAHNSLGSALAQKGRTDQAIRSFRRAVELDSNFAVALYNLAGSYHRRGQSVEAEDARRRLLELDPELAGKLDRLLQPRE